MAHTQSDSKMATKHSTAIKASQDKDIQKNYEALGKMLEVIYETGYSDRKKAYKFALIKGALSGLGSVIGATLVIALLLWFLSLFSQVPLVDHVVNNIRHSISRPPVR